MQNGSSHNLEITDAIHSLIAAGASRLKFRDGNSFYDGFFVRWAAAKIDDLEVFRDFANQSHLASIVDLGGGFGRVAFTLAKEGHHVTIVDCSGEMLRVGKEIGKCFNLEHRLKWIKGNFNEPLDFLPANSFQLAICAYNTLNETLDSLVGFFNNVAYLLVPEGLLQIRVLSSEPYVRSGLIEMSGSFVDEEGAIWTISTVSLPLDVKLKTQQLFVFFDCYREGRLIERHVRTLKRRIWTPDEICASAMKAGLTPINIGENYSIFINKNPSALPPPNNSFNRTRN